MANKKYKKEEEKDLVLGPGLLTRLILATPTHLEEKNINWGGENKLEEATSNH